MNQGRMWCVVNPTVGLPLFLGGVVVMSLIVHASVMTQTTWVASFFEGGKGKTKVSENVAPAPAVAAMPLANSGYAITVTPTASADGKGQSSFVITVSPSADGSVAARAVIDDGKTTNTASLGAGQASTN